MQVLTTAPTHPTQVLQTNLLTSNAAPPDKAKEWYVRRAAANERIVERDVDGEEAGAHDCAALEGGAVPGGGATKGGGETGLFGPFDASELREYLEKNRPDRTLALGEGFECYARGQGEMEARSSWRRPKEISHLAWGCLAQGTAMLSYTQLGMLVLDIFLGLTAMHPTRTPTGALIHPMPTPKKVC